MPRVNSGRGTRPPGVDFETVYASFPPAVVAELDRHAVRLGLARTIAIRLAVKEWMESQPPLPREAPPLDKARLRTWNR